MGLNNRVLRSIALLSITLLAVTACSISYRFNGASIDYTKVQTLSIADFPNRAPLVFPALAQMVSEGLRDQFSRQTRLEFQRTGGDLQIDGEITGYEVANMAVGADAYATEAKLTVTVMVRFTNKKDPTEDFEQSFSAFRTFSGSMMLSDVQDQLCAEIVEELSDIIFNACVARW